LITATTSAIAPLRQQRLSPESTPSGDALTGKQQSASDALDALKGLAESGPRERKAMAEEKLKRLQEQMTALMRWGFAPGATAQRTLQLAKELGSAAAQFADAVSAGKAARSSSGLSATIPDASTDAPADSAVSVSDETGANETALPQAYRDVMTDELPGQTLSSGDQDTVTDFRSAASQLKFMLEDAARKLRDGRRPAAFTETGKEHFAGIDRTLSALDGRIVAAGDITGTGPGVASFLLL